MDVEENTIITVFLFKMKNKHILVTWKHLKTFNLFLTFYFAIYKGDFKRVYLGINPCTGICQNFMLNETFSHVYFY